MPEPLKYLYDDALLKNLSRSIQRHYPEFDESGFKQFIIDDDWDKKELKQRMQHISIALHQFLPLSLQQSVAILTRVASQFNGFQYMFFPGHVELYGMDNLELSMLTLESMTEYSSAEFAVRPFIKKYPKQMLQQLKLWSESDNHHVRRLASEGCRPRLPWAMALPLFKEDPSAILPILDTLKLDDSDYVRKSVANNLNDISKDNPEVVITIAKQWLGNHKHTDRVVKHACRTLLKQGLPEVMNLFGYSSAKNFTIKDLANSSSVQMGDDLLFSFALSNKMAIGKLRLEYAIGFMRKNGSHSKKVFKISESEVKSTHKRVAKKHPFRLITTRKYYSGLHYLSIIANGVELTRSEFELQIK